MKEFDVVIIGAGHNGLVAANYLAKHGLNVAVFEYRSKPGGLVETAEYKGVKYSRLSYSLGLFPKKIKDELGIDFPTFESNITEIFVTDDGKVVKIWRERSKRIESFVSLGQTRYKELENLISSYKLFLEKEVLFRTYPMSFEDFKYKLESKGLSIFLENTRKFLHEFIDETYHPFFHQWFLMDFPAYIMGYYFSWDWKLVKGGIGTVANILYKRAKEFGTEFFFNEKVEEIVFDEKVRGIRTNKEYIHARNVLHAASPVLLNDLTRGALKVHHPGFRYGWVKTNVILREWPKLPEYMKEHPEILHCLPIGEVAISSMIDDMGGKVMSVMGSLEETKEFFPDIEKNAIFIEELTAKDIEKEFNLPFGDMNHLPMSQKYLFDNRPVKGWGYTTPIQGLYITGSGTHPGGQITGIPGRNAALKILESFKK